MALQDQHGGAARPDVAERGVKYGRSRNLPAPRLAQAILLAALLSYLTITMLNILGADSAPATLPPPLSGSPLVFLLQLLHSAPGANRACAWQSST